MSFKFLIYIIALTLVIIHQAKAMTLDEYLSEVQSRGLDVKQYSEEVQASQLEGREADLSFKPLLFANAQITRDKALSNPPLITYDELDSDTYSLGVSEQFDFGLQTKLYYQLNHTNYINSPFAATTSLDFYDAKPIVELTMPLWQNGFGRTARAQQDLLRSRSQANALGSGAQNIQLAIQAETTYWSLASAKEAVDVQTQALKSAQGVKDYVERKARMNLGEESDVVQASALVEARNLQLMQAQNDARSAAQDFNALRFQNSSEIPQAMDKVTTDVVANLPVISARPGDRLDVMAAEAQSKASSADAQINAERNRPTFDLYGSYALNGRDDTVANANTNISEAGRPTTMIGLRFSMPLDMAAQNDALQGAHVREQAAQTSYQKAIFNQEKDWSNLVRKITESETNLKLATSVERIQAKKLELEKSRLRQGRTTTYQVLLFEQDLLDAQLSRVRTAAQVLSLRSQVKAYQVQVATGSRP